MSFLLFLPGLLEIALVFVAAIFFLPRDFSIPRPRWWVSALLFIALAFTGTSIFLGGGAVASMAVKVILFALAIAFAMREPRAARWWLLVSVVIELVAQAAAGNVVNKLAAVPFLLTASLWATSRAQLGARELLVIRLALIAECVQALAFESRGLLIAVGMTCAALFVPLKVVRRMVVTSAVLLPIVYPLVLTLISAALLSGTNLITATSSNFERSAMAAWSIKNLSEYPLVGPGGSLYVDEMNFIKALGDQASSDAYDPHQFLLSAWIWLGSFAIAALYVAWCAIWFFKRGARHGVMDARIRLFSILAILAILTFVLSAPDTSRRVQVALLTGIAIAGLRHPLILVQKNRVLDTRYSR